MGGFRLISDYRPAGDQPQAIKGLTEGLASGARDQVLLGVTGSGKTFTMAHVIQNMQRPALIMAHNKTLAAQLYGEMKSFFPDNAVEYFVSYYDYYQPEAYVPRTDTYIEKDSSINEQIDRMRHSATRAMLTRPDVIVIASVSCIYGIGAVETYGQMALEVRAGEPFAQQALLKKLIELQYERHDMDFHRGAFRVRGDSVDLFPSHLEDEAWRISFFGDEVESISAFDPLTGEKRRSFDAITVFPNSHYVTPRPTLERAIGHIKAELKSRLTELRASGKLVEAQRLEQRTTFDLEMMVETGACKGIENYSRFLNGSAPGAPPPTLFQYLPKDAILFVDESHVSVPQIGGMSGGDKARKATLVEYGFRLPSAMDNRPLTFDEWNAMRPPTVFVSATPGKWELAQTGGVFVEQVIRPTGLIDPPCDVRPVASQVDDLLAECRLCVGRDQRVLVTTLTKRMAEELTEYMDEAGLAVRYLHSDVDTLERIEIIRDLRLGKFQVLVGVNLLREGLDIPECGLVAILDADKEGFLRSATSLIQTIGRAARNIDSKVILYADRMTDSMRAALSETERRRTIQQEYNAAHGITPASVKKSVREGMGNPAEHDYYTVPLGDRRYAVAEDLKDPQALVKALRERMLQAAADLEFEEAGKLRDRIMALEGGALEGGGATPRVKGRSKQKQAGFTLLEMVIVITIIGIIMGSILVVRNMQNAAQIQAVLGELDRYTKATQMFLDKFQHLPGDFDHATDNWGIDAANCTGVAFNTDSATAFSQVKTAATCNGNADSQITGTEMFRAWQQLADAGMIEGQYTGTGAYAQPAQVLGYGVPVSSYPGGGGYTLVYEATTGLTANNFPMTGQHVIELGTPDPACAGNAAGDFSQCITHSPLLTPQDAAAIDAKIDDGAPATGTVLARPNGSTLTPGCVDATNTLYNAAGVTTAKCGLIVSTGF